MAESIALSPLTPPKCLSLQLGWEETVENRKEETLEKFSIESSYYLPEVISVSASIWNVNFVRAGTWLDPFLFSFSVPLLLQYKERCLLQNKYFIYNFELISKFNNQIPLNFSLKTSFYGWWMEVILTSML